jgi:hypothetical protein
MAAKAAAGRYVPAPGPDAPRDAAVAKIRYALATAVYRANRDGTEHARGRRFAEAFAYGQALQAVVASLDGPDATAKPEGELELPGGARREAWDWLRLDAARLLGKDWLA